MKQALGGLALSALVLVGLGGAAQAACAWAGTHWNCGDRLIYPKTYPWGTWVADGKYAMPMLPPASDVQYPATAPAAPR
jgi:hypothetical protein